MSSPCNSTEEYFTCNEDVVGSNPTAGSEFKPGDLIRHKKGDIRSVVFTAPPDENYIFTWSTQHLLIHDDPVVVLAITDGNQYQRCMLLLHKANVIWARCISTDNDVTAWKRA